MISKLMTQFRRGNIILWVGVV